MVSLPSRCWVGGLQISTGLHVRSQANLITQGGAQNKAQGRKKPLNKAQGRKKPLKQPARANTCLRSLLPRLYTRSLDCILCMLRVSRESVILGVSTQHAKIPSASLHPALAWSS